MKTTIKNTKDIPYCGHIEIEGYRDTDGNIVEYYGTTNPENNWENKLYFRAKWHGDKHGAKTNCYYLELGGILE